MKTLQLALRRLSRAPGFSLVAVTSLAVCCAANLMLFAVVHSVLLKPLPFPEAERLVTVYNSYPNAGLPRNPASVRDYFSRREALPAFSAVSSYRHGVETQGEPGAVSRMGVLYITPDFFDTLGVDLAMGRVFDATAMEPGGPRQVVVSHAFWRDQLQGAANPVGRELRLGGRSYQVTGVLPEGFHFLSQRADLFLPLVSNAEQRALNALHGVHAEMIARLAPGASVEQALAQLQAHYDADSQGYPWAEQVAAAGFRLHVAGLHADHVASVRPLLLWLQAGAAGLLLVGLFNLVNLLLVRHSARAGEQAVQHALGARRRDLLAPIALENLLLCAAGIGLGVVLARFGLLALGHYVADALPLAASIDVSLPVMVMASVLVPMLAALLSLPIALAQRGALRSRAAAAMSSRSESPRAQRLRHGFGALQIAAAFVLLTGAALMSLGLRSALEADPGFDPRGVIVAELSLPASQYPDGAARLAFAERLAERAGTGMEALGFSTNVPVRGRSGVNDMQSLQVVGFTPQPGVSPLLHFRYGVNADYFRAMGIDLVEGRTLTAADLRGSARHVVVDEDFARQYWPQGRAIGQRLFDGPDAGAASDAFTVVGVVRAVKQTELGEDTRNGVAYFPYPFLAQAEVFVSARARGDEREGLAALRTLLLEADPTLAADRIEPMQARLEATLLRQSLPAALASLFSLAALALAGLGCFGVLSYGVTLRRREIGLRMAVGARGIQVVSRVLANGLQLLAGGALLGTAAIAIAAFVLPSVATDLPAPALPSIALSLGLLAAVSLIASLLPALRAAAIPPTVALRGP